MDKSGEVDEKYQKLAAEYSKVRSQAAVLKKALLDEQAKSNDLKDVIKRFEQKIRKHDQEMESLTFRNEQLTKRISVLQQELQINSHNKKGKNKVSESVIPPDIVVLNEELQKKILENAQLVSSMADKDYELSDYKERVSWLEMRITNLEKELHEKEGKHLEETTKLLAEKKITDLLENDAHKSNDEANEVAVWKSKAERWRSECDVLRSKPQSEEKLTEYFESQLRELLEAKDSATSEAKSLWAENTALYSRLDHLITSNKEAEGKLQRGNEELTTTIENYKVQLDAMTEHLAAQNDKITKQCDEIQALRHKLTSKK